MQPFRVHGLVASEPAPVPCFGRRSPRRYGRRAFHRDTPQPTPAPVAADDDPFPWVDQEFEEYFFE